MDWFLYDNGLRHERVKSFMYNVEKWSTEAATRGVIREKVFLKISQNSLENTCVRASF